MGEHLVPVGLTQEGAREYKDAADDAQAVKHTEDANEVEERSVEVQLVLGNNIQGHQVTWINRCSLLSILDVNVHK